MTKEQIEKDAKDYACTISEGPTARHTLAYQAYIAGVESRQAEIDRACELIKELVKLYHVNMPYYDNFVVWKAEEFLKGEQIK